MALPLRTVVGTFSNPDGTPAAGSKILFQLLTTLVDADDDVTVVASKVQAVLDDQGSFSVELVPDTGAVAPTPVYAVRELFGVSRSYNVIIPAGSGSIDLSDLAPIGTAPTPPSAYVLLGDYDTAVADLQAADATEATTRAAAVTAETTRAEAAETALTTSVGTKATQTALDAEATARATADALSVPLAQRGAANGVATLDGSGTVPDGQIPASIARDGEVSAAVAALVNSAPGALDTLGELAAALQADESAAATLTTLVGTKAAQTALDAEVTARAAADAGKAQRLVRTVVKTANYSAAAGDLIPVDTTSAAVTVTLPNAPAAGSRAAVKLIVVGAGHAVTVACAGSDVFNKTGGATTVSLTLLNQAMQVQYDTGGIWTVVADDLPRSALDATYAPVLTPTATKVAAYIAAVGDLALMNVPAGATALTLPTAPTDKAQVGYRSIGASAALPLQVMAGGSDTIGTVGATSANVIVADEVTVLQYDAANTRWTSMSNVKALAGLDALAGVFNIKNYGARCDYVEVTDGATTTGTVFTLTCATSAPFKVTDVGKLVTIANAAAGPKLLAGTITAYISATQVTVTSTQTAISTSAKQVAFGTDDTTAIQAAITAASALNYPARIAFPGHSAVTSLTVASKLTFAGYGPGASGLHVIGQQSGGTLPLFKGLAGSAGTPYVDLQFIDLEMDGRSISWSAYNVALKAIYLQYVQRLRVRGCYIHDFPATGMGADFLEAYDMSNNILVNNGRLNNGTTDLGGSNIGIAVGSTLDEGGVISGNVCKGAKRFGIFLEAQSGTPTPSRKHRIINNSCTGNKDGIGDCGSQGTVIAGNQCISNTRYGIVHNSGTVAGAICGWESTVTGNLVTDNTSHGMYYDGSGASATASQVGKILYANNTVRRNGGSGVQVDVTTKNIPRIEIVNNAVEDNTGVGIVLAQPSGTALLQASKIAGNSLLGNSSAYSNAMTLTDLVARNNEGLNPQGPAVIAVGASPFTYMAGNTVEIVYIDGGTVSLIVKGGTTLRTATGVAVPLAPNESVVVTYTVAPAMVKDRQ